MLMSRWKDKSESILILCLYQGRIFSYFEIVLVVVIRLDDTLKTDFYYEWLDCHEKVDTDIIE